MKNLILITSMMALGLMGVGCSKSNSSSAGIAVQQAGIDSGVPNAGNQASGSSTGGVGYATDLVATYDKMRQYTTIAGSLSTLNNPTNIKINLNMAQSESGRYGGDITISYTDNGQYRSAIFKAGLGRNQTISGGYDNNELEAKYNYWFTIDNKLSFTGFFEDSFGAIVISLTPDTTIGGGNDAEPLSVSYKGEVYFRNFKTEKTTPYRSCWFIYTGLDGHDCRSNVIMTKTGLAPGDGAGYTLLGTFTNVNIKQAFNINN